MAKLDTRKRAEWQKRFARFEASGLTVAEFCRNEKIGTHAFYYWDKRLGGRSNARRRSAAGQCAGKPGGAVRLDKEGPSPMVHFTWGSKVQISIPADCIDAIRCVLEHATHELDEPVSAFRQVVVTEG